MWTLYKHVNKDNGKLYYGITSRAIENRWGANGNGYTKDEQDTCFARAIKKYGWNNFEHIIIATNLTHEEATDCEHYYIARDKTNICRWGKEAKGYNMTDGGEGHGGYKVPDEVKNKISEKNKGKKRSEETKRKISEKNKGKKITEEQKEKISDSLKGRILTEEHKKHVSESKKGKKRPPTKDETREKLSKANKGRKPWNTGKHLSEEHKEKLREKSKQNAKKIKVEQISTGKIYNSIKEAAEDNGLDIKNLSRGLKEHRKNYTDWRYVE